MRHLSALFCFFTIALAAATTQDAVPLKLSPDGTRDARVELMPDGVYQITAAGRRPAVLVTAPGSFDAAKNRVLAFDYFCAKGTRRVAVSFGNSEDALETVQGPGLSASEGWSVYALDLNASAAWNGNWKLFRIAFAARNGESVRIRNLRLRPPTARELELGARIESIRAHDKELNGELSAYLKHDYPARLSRIYAGPERITIEGDLGGQTGNLFLVEVPLYQNITERKAFDYAMPLRGKQGRFAVEVMRYRTLPDRLYDRIFSKWAIARQEVNNGPYELLSHGRWTDEVVAKWNLPDERPRSKKGLAGFNANPTQIEDLDALGLSSVTVNIFMGEHLRSQPGPDRVPFQFDGKTYYADRNAVERLDKTMLEAAKRNLIVSAIILIPKPEAIADPIVSKVLAHPDADPSGIYPMPNLTTAEGVEYYAAGLDFLAARYSRPDKKYGRIHNWIAQNEVDVGWVWTNAGEKSALTYMDLYHKSMRAIHYIARKYNPHARVFISLDYYWNWTAEKHGYLPKELLDMLLDFSKAEGDFEWAIAQHPYPETLVDPRTWEDKKAEFNINTPMITFKNIEVLNAWANQPRTFFRGIEPRIIHLSEQGLNSKDYSQEQLQEQAAGMAYAWKKIEKLDNIEAFQYHNWADSRGEGGLRIGLHKFRDEPGDPYGKKPIWYVYKALETPEEDEACEFAKKIIGVRDWSEVRYTGPIGGLELPKAPRDLKADNWVATDALGRTLPDHKEAGSPKKGRYVGVFYFLTHNSPGRPGPLDVTKILAANPGHPKFGRGSHYWGEPEFGYYTSTDEWVIRRHGQMLADAGVDTVIFDTTNNVTYPDVYRTIAKVWNQMRAEGERTPQFCFLASRKSVEQIWADLYSKGEYKDLWFMWKGKPLLLHGQDGISGTPMWRVDEFPQEIQDFFSIRESWAWDSLPWYRDGRDQWPWVAHYPQVIGWHESPARPENVPVAVAQHPLSNIGRSFHDGQEPEHNDLDVTPFTPQGLHFQEQWDRAIAVDPEFVFVTGWNEFTAGSMIMGQNVEESLAFWRFFPGGKLGRAGKELKPGDLYFIDQYNQEYSRDIEPMKGGHTDNYYYQLVANIRRYKGVREPELPGLPATIDIRGPFSQWDTIEPEYRSHVHDTDHRNAPGNYQTGPYVNNTGRNDIVTLKVARDKDNVYFYAETREPLTPHTDPFWMLLFIDADQNGKTGWEGYDYMVNAGAIEKSLPGGKWGDAVKVPFRAEGNKLMIGIPRAAMGQTGARVAFDFHWSDNIQKLGDITEFFANGDQAPPRRFNYRYVAEE